MFMAAKQQTPGSTNPGKIIDHIDVKKAALSYESCLLSDLMRFFDLLYLNRNVSVTANSI